ncbi:MAG: methyltransferase type 11 [Frankiales bacterium]|nr:methyltransferase type 11 [Frankiales bacterium]
MSGHTSEDYFEPAAWEQRYAGTGEHWSGTPNAQLVAVLTGLRPGTALDVGCGEGGDVVWLAQQGWRVTGADFSFNGLRRAAHRVEQNDVGSEVDWWQVDAREFNPAGRSWDLVTTHFLHPPDAGMVDVTRRLATAVAPGGHLLVVGHAPSHHFTQLSEGQRNAMWLAEDLLPALPEDFEPLVVEQRPRTMTHDGQPHDIEDSTLFARRRL